MSKAAYDWLSTTSTGLVGMMLLDDDWTTAVEAFLEVLRLTGETAL